MFQSPLKKTNVEVVMADSIFTPTVQYRPFKFPKLMSFAAEQNIGLAWHENQIELSTDVSQFHTEGGLATKDVSHESNKNNLSKMLSLFTQMDVGAGELYAILVPHVKNNEARNWLLTAGSKEGVHQRSYALAVETLDFPDSTWGEFMEYKEMQDKIDLMTGIDGRDHSKPLDFAKTLVQLLLAEGICLFGAFACMLNLKRFGLMLGTNTINEWSLRDEERHVEGNIVMLKAIINADLTQAEIEELYLFITNMVNAYVSAEHKFIDLVFEMGDQQDLTKEQMKEYITYLGQVRLHQLGFEVQPVKNPLEWMAFVLGGEQHSNFFEKKETAYDHEGLVGHINFSKYKGLKKL